MVQLDCYILTYFFFLTTVFSLPELEQAWNGYATPESKTPSSFTPFYVPPGAQYYDSLSPLVKYSGKWFTRRSSSYVGGSQRWTTEPGASMTLIFTGTGIEWFGTCDRKHGMFLVYVDRRQHRLVDGFCNRSMPLGRQRLFWTFDLDDKMHTIKIVNTSKRPWRTECDLDAFVVTRPRRSSTGRPIHAPLRSSGSKPLFLESRGTSSSTSQWTITQRGVTGVNAMQLAVVSSSHAIIIDKVEHNPLTIDGHPAWAALYNLDTHEVRPLALRSNSFCAGGTFLGNGTLINVGGNPVVEDYTSAADFGDVNGLQAIRIFEPCDDTLADACRIYEDHLRIRLASPRWYNTVVRISDGSAMIIGGSKKGGWINNHTVNNPTIEYFPPKFIHGNKGLPIHLPFLVDTLNSNLFPIAFALPNGKIFVAANRDAIIYDWKANREEKLPRIPNGMRVTYPMAGTGLLLPLSPKNHYAPEILLCGGSDIDDHKPSYKISSQDRASAQCVRMKLTKQGIRSGWQVEQMPEARTMLDAVILPTGKILIVNGAGSGISGYGNVINQIGVSNADHPVLRPVLYDPLAPVGQRFSSTDMPTSSIPRMYHSVATLTPAGKVMIAGSNPNLDRSELRYRTEYKVEWISPPYMNMPRPRITEGTPQIGFGTKVKIKVAVEGGMKGQIEVTLMDFGYVTHGVHANSRLVYLECSIFGDMLTVTGPPSGNVYPPGPGWLHVIVSGVPSKAIKVMVGTGEGPPVDHVSKE